MKNKILNQLLIMSRNTFFSLVAIGMLATMAHANDADSQPSLKEVPVSLRVNQTEVAKVFGILEHKTGFKFTYNDAVVVTDTKISLTVKNSNLYDVLSTISSQESLQFRRVGDNIHVTRVADNLKSPKVYEDLMADINIKGTVKDKDGMSLPGVSVLIKGTSTGAITDIDGNFELTVDENATLVISYIGYKMIEVSVNSQTSFSIVLEEDVTKLNEVVVTATGLRRKVEMGNAISRLNVADEVKIRPINNISDLLQGQAAGVQIFSSGGSTGMGSRIRIRGSSSASLSNEPVIYVDGVLINNQPNSISFETGGQSPSRLNDINPEDIESIEVIKGPSAATLYGSVAANGVIRITTKRGQQGKARWTAYLEGGAVNDITTYPENWEAFDVNGDKIFNYEATTASLPITTNSFQPLNDSRTRPFRTGSLFGFGASVSGGTDAVTYFISGNFADNQGVLPINNIRRANFRANLGAKITDDLKVTVTTGYTKSDLELPLNDNYALGLMGQGLNGFPSIDQGQDGWGEFTPEELFTIDTRQNIDRFTSGINLEWTALESLTLRASAGLDFTSRWDNQFFPTGEAPAFLNFDQGARFSNRFNDYVTTFDASATYKTNFSDNISSRTSIGFQYLGVLSQGTLATGLQLVAGSSSIAGAAQTFSNEQTTEQITTGVFLEEQIGFGDKLFVTGAIRADRGSAFGPALNSVIYPKLSTSWVISDESFFNVGGNWLSSLRLRGAWGASGVQPGTNDALRFFTPIAATVGGVSVTGVTFGSVGNADLKPERSVEVELGLDASMFSDRVGLELTYFDKETEDALVFRQLPPSLGVGAGRFENLGSVKNSGVEISLPTQIVRSDKIGFDLNVIASFLNNELKELGEGIEPVIFGVQRHVEGFPLGGYWDEEYTFNDANGDGFIAQDEVTVGETVYLGAPFATTELSFMPALRFFNDQIVLTGLLSYRGGQRLYNNTGAWRNGNSNTDELNDPNASLASQARAVASKFYGTNAGYIEDASFWRIREISLTFNAPQKWMRSAALSRMSLTISGQNLGLWTQYSGLDPEISAAGQSNFVSQEFLSQPPIRMWKARLNLSF
jgi:TonB-linked SusC/RagA family outer membrane protein